MKPILSVRDLMVNIEVEEGTLHAVRGVDFDLFKNDSLGIVGESGSGKSMTTKAIIKLLPENASMSGRVVFDGVDIATVSQKAMAYIRGNQIAIINQNPSNNLNPIIKIGRLMFDAILARKQYLKSLAKHHLKVISKSIGVNLFKNECPEEYKNNESLMKSLEIYKTKISKHAIKEEILTSLSEVGIDYPERVYDQYPFELSGGMQQRVIIAIALSGNPKVVIFDEPTTALDVSTQAQIIDLIKKLQEKKRFSLIFISHNLAVISKIAKRVLVMYAGKILESGSIEQVYNNPTHPYTKALFKALPSMTGNKKLYAIPGTTPTLIDVKDMDQFAYRNTQPLEIDFKQEPPLFEVEKGHYARTWLLHEYAPKLQDEVLPDKEKEENSFGEKVVLEMKGIERSFYTRHGTTEALKDVNLKLYEKEILCIVGASGSGKTTLARIIVGLTKQDKGEIVLKNKVLSQVNNGKYKYDFSKRKDIQMIFQDSSSALNSRMTIFECIAEGLEIQKKYSKEEIMTKVKELLKEVELDESILDRYPYMLSGGQRQRVQIARALAVSPSILIADEPVSDLDVSIQASVIHLFVRLKKERGISIIFIAHDLSVVKYIADHVGVFCHGRLIEYGTNDAIFTKPTHAYTIELMKAVPQIGVEQDYSNIRKFTPEDVKQGVYVNMGSDHIVFDKEEKQ